jgi:hypothetical protein
MAVTLVEEITKRSGNDDDRAQRQYTRKFLVYVNDVDTSINAVLNAIGIPTLYETYPTDFGSLCRSRSAEEYSHLVWEVTCKYSTQTLDETNQGTENPIDRVPEVDWDAITWQKPLVKDINGRHVRNSAKKPILGVDIDDSRPVLRISRFESDYDEERILAYKDAVNSDTFLGGLPGTWKFKSIKAKRHYEAGELFYKTSYELEYREEGWQPSVLDQGYTYLDSTGKEVAFLTKQGTPVQSPSLLNGAGGSLAKSKGTLDVDIDESQVTAMVDRLTGDRFPPAPFTVEIDDEEILVGLADVLPGDQTHLLQLTRGYNGTTAAAHTEGTTVQQLPVFLEFEGYNSLPFGDLGLNP